MNGTPSAASLRPATVTNNRMRFISVLPFH
jgi:hypothetical protein